MNKRFNPTKELLCSVLDTDHVENQVEEQVLNQVEENVWDRVQNRVKDQIIVHLEDEFVNIWY